MGKPKTLIEWLWEYYDLSHDLALEALEKEQLVAYAYFQKLAQDYLGLIDFIADNHPHG